MKIGGTIIVHNAIEFDYCIEAAVESLLGVCENVLVFDGGSTDGTWGLLRSGFKDPYNTCLLLTIRKGAWDIGAMGVGLSEMTNEARESLQSLSGERYFHINLQADEVIHEDDYPLIREYAKRGGTYALNRLNFWMDAQHILPPEEKVGSRIVRMAPSHISSVGDAQSLDPSGGFEITPIRIFHYGFIRNMGAFVAKSRGMQQAVFNTVDPIIDAVEKEGVKALLDPKHPTAVAPERLLPYRGTHPKAAHKWLKEHGYEV